MKKEYKALFWICCGHIIYVSVIVSTFTKDLGIIFGSPYVAIFFTIIIFVIVKKLKKGTRLVNTTRTYRPTTKAKALVKHYTYTRSNGTTGYTTINPQYYKDVEPKCPYCNLVSHHDVCIFCKNDRRDHVKKQLYLPVCPYCDTAMDQYDTVCGFCGHDKQKVKVKVKEEKRSRIIPIAVQREVWRRDEGRCIECGTNERLEYDHIIPFSKGGSNTVRNIQLLCESCNRKKYNNI